MQVGVRVEEEDSRTGARHHCCSAYLTFVALSKKDPEGGPSPKVALPKVRGCGGSARCVCGYCHLPPSALPPRSARRRAEVSQRGGEAVAGRREGRGIAVRPAAPCSVTGFHTPGAAAPASCSLLQVVPTDRHHEQIHAEAARRWVGGWAQRAAWVGTRRGGRACDVACVVNGPRCCPPWPLPRPSHSRAPLTSLPPMHHHHRRDSRLAAREHMRACLEQMASGTELRLRPITHAAGQPTLPPALRVDPKGELWRRVAGCWRC